MTMSSRGSPLWANSDVNVRSKTTARLRVATIADNGSISVIHHHFVGFGIGHGIEALKRLIAAPEETAESFERLWDADRGDAGSTYPERRLARAVSRAHAHIECKTAGYS
jgi:hypothetical protein